MEAVMKKYLCILAVLGCFSVAGAANAQLPANPWAPHPNDGYFGENVPDKSPDKSPDAPAYGNGPTGGDILPVDPWAKSRDRTGIQTWRGSGQHGRLNYVGEATTFGTDYGQERLAPEVNRHNMLVLTEHLRKLGYKIPDSYDENIKNMPKNYTNILRESYQDVYAADDPLSKAFSNVMSNFEDGLGLDFQNILFNTMDLLGTD